jgi:hypothetical protein
MNKIKVWWALTKIRETPHTLEVTTYDETVVNFYLQAKYGECVLNKLLKNV